MDIVTDGSIHPKDALKEAAKILIHHFMLFSDEKITLDTDEKMENEEFDEEILHMRQLLKTKLVDLDLSVRALSGTMHRMRCPRWALPLDISSSIMMYIAADPVFPLMLRLV